VAHRTAAALLLAALASAAGPARAAEARVSLDETLKAAQRAAPELLLARAREGTARAEVGIAGTYPNPTASIGTSTQTARFSGTISVPLVVLGQRGAAVDAARADEQTARLDTAVTWNDVRQAIRRAYVALWLAGGELAARQEAAAIEAKLEGAVVERVQIGSAPEIDSLRVHAERLRADADVIDAAARLTASATKLGRWMGLRAGAELRAAGPAAVPEGVPALGELLARLEGNASVRREQSGVRAAEARVARERALVRPTLALDLGVDAGDPTLNDVTNYRAQLAFDLPIFNRRGAYIERERAVGDEARARLEAARLATAAELTTAYRLYESAMERQRALVGAVVPASEAAARATEEAYSLGRAPLLAVLDAQRALVEVRLSALEAAAACASAWADVEHAMGAS
jgi:cobalt-zinc-cadmium efflux system outer membrane protein